MKVFNLIAPSSTYSAVPQFARFFLSTFFLFNVNTAEQRSKEVHCTVQYVLEMIFKGTTRPTGPIYVGI